ncbi:HPP family protein [Stachybotrys elegans]|uniref:HPP family protein n=1 Tax=Stachybotrys elegans TaxID=80388 RepID=A0A8K0WP53_9HYPO|nr:HPP family protein [Stachybotrys elegans]
MSSTWHFDIDRYLNPFVPRPPWQCIPYPVSRFLGYREHKPKSMGNVRPILWATVGIFCSLSAIEAASMHIPSFEHRGVPIIIGSFGAAAVLEFYAIESPLGQPRNAIFGQLIAAFVGISICQLFKLSDNFNEIRWAGGGLACALATALMALTKTVHPPAGATALLAVVDDAVADLAWFLFPVMLLGCGLMLTVALIINNIERQFPVYWWTPEELRPKGAKQQRSRRPSEVHAEKKSRDSVHEGTDSEATLDLEAGDGASSTGESRASHEIILRAGEVIVPDHVNLRQEELQFLESICLRLS